MNKTFFDGIWKAGALHRGQVDQTSNRIERHRMPIVSATGTGHHKTDGVFITRLGRFNGSATFQINARCPRHFGIRVSRNQIASNTIQDIEEAVFRSLHDHLTHHTIKRKICEHQGLYGGVVPVISRCSLVVPGYSTVIDI